MTAGKVSKLVTSYGSMWGRIQPEGESREIFFNPDGLTHKADYPALALGQDVYFLEQTDVANGTQAVHVIPKVSLEPERPNETLMTWLLWAVILFALMAAGIGIVVA